MANKSTTVKKLATTPLDSRLVKKLNKGGTTLSYVSGTTIQDMLDEAFGVTHSIQYSDPWVTTFDPVKSKNGPYQPQQVIHVKCTITVWIDDPEAGKPIQVIREGYGSATVKPKQEEMAVKSAATDAMKKAAYSFGFARDLARDEEEQDFYDEQAQDIWTSDKYKKFENEWATLNKFFAANNVTRDQIPGVVSKLTENKYSEILPSNIEDIIELMKEYAAKQKAA